MGPQFRETNKIGKDAEQVFVKEEIETDPIVKKSSLKMKL